MIYISGGLKNKMLIVTTSADIEHPLREMRIQEYLKTISWLNENVSEHSVAWIETVKQENCFIEEHLPVFYSNCHNSYYRNNGSNWGKAIEMFLNCADIHEDYVCHLTGRYHFIDKHFFEVIENNPGYDVYAKDDGHSQYVTGCFVMKTKHFIDWINQTDWDHLNSAMLNLEKSLWNYTRDNNLKTYEYDSLHMEWNIFGNGNPTRVLV